MIIAFHAQVPQVNMVCGFNDYILQNIILIKDLVSVVPKYKRSPIPRFSDQTTATT